MFLGNLWFLDYVSELNFLKEAASIKIDNTDLISQERMIKVHFGEQVGVSKFAVTWYRCQT
jgi:hypothetical protein